jgi:hypothetical protein
MTMEETWERHLHGCPRARFCPTFSISLKEDGSVHSPGMSMDVADDQRDPPNRREHHGAHRCAPASLSNVWSYRPPSAGFRFHGLECDHVTVIH